MFAGNNTIYHLCDRIQGIVVGASLERTLGYFIVLVNQVLGSVDRIVVITFHIIFSRLVLIVEISALRGLEFRKVFTL